jgi:gas vesicle protein
VTDDTHKKRKSVNFVSGLALGTAAAAAATFLYKTKKGKKVRRQLKHHINDAKEFLAEHIEDIKTQAKKLESTLEEQNLATQKKTKKVKRRVKQTVSSAKKRVFRKSGKPLAK